MRAGSRFNDDMIRRDDVPRDAFLIIHDLAYEYRSGRLRDYARRAQAVLKLRSVKTSKWPYQYEWLMKTLRRAYKDKALVLSMLGDIARLIRERKEGKRTSSTTCISCGGWIPKDREEHGNHTCSQACYDWYRKFRRAALAARYCRYCGRPNNHPEAAQSRLRRRPKKVSMEERREGENRLRKQAGAASQGYVIKLPKVPLGSNPVVLLPNSPEGVPKGALEEAIERQAER